MDTFDLVILGCGPAGEKGAAQAAWFGKKVAVVERAEEPGGACVHTGTLPSKSLREVALALARVRGGSGMEQLPGLTLQELFGEEYARRVEAPPLTIDRLMRHKDAIVRHELQRIRANLERHGVNLLRGDASFVDPHTVRVVGPEGERLLTARNFLIATGSRPARSRELPCDHHLVCDSDSILSLARVPASLAVVGAGVIGCEYATIFAALGSNVTLVDGRPRLLPSVDADVAERLAAGMAWMGVTLKMGVNVSACSVEEERVRLRLSTDEELVVDAALGAAGRQGNTATLGLEAAGVHIDARGLVKVDEHYRTSAAHIYAAGDVIGFPALASTSMEQARVAVCHAIGETYKTRLATHPPYAIYTIPELASVGMSEDEALQKGEEVLAGRAYFRDNARGQIQGDTEGFVKLVFRASDKRLLGAHIVAERASELIHVAEMTLMHAGTIDDYIDAVFNYPTMGEAFKYAAYDGLGALARRARIVLQHVK